MITISPDPSPSSAASTVTRTGMGLGNSALTVPSELPVRATDGMTMVIDPWSSGTGIDRVMSEIVSVLPDICSVPETSYPVEVM